ncbi:hypothetical protein [Solemya velum gill symbiont]|uniref:hypothetical protein n=1 Tax=Solemya velum gill symbiont TaxID=2340 RepID=UPI00099652D9|nr:hypothetical protein [Solemya velum gill symbiont]OOZ45758.1 hypothetical protein BOW37_02710 [Solemya velum gill symbiont]OOZ47015.1 hypothetical protein BOW38_05375 [Solemya velum gill symbiont]OOZ48430.1 hypothetical protein BOW39_10540 [Solemya velum gill symbiont]OOZ52114.1 hypothetical protein BOW40_04700 [Solemya velum gill symbiont]OOZ54806.1 hypothetical protein BOW41_05405 [Solemya velum gill symbiont]
MARKYLGIIFVTGLVAVIAFGTYWFAEQNRVYQDQRSVIIELNPTEVQTPNTTDDADLGEEVAATETIEPEEQSAALPSESLKLKETLKEYAATREKEPAKISGLRKKLDAIKQSGEIETTQNTPDSKPDERLSGLNERIEALKQYINSKEQ